MLYLKEAEIRTLITMEEAIAATESAFVARARQRAYDVPRQRVRLPEASLNIMQGASLDHDVLGFKVYYVLPTGHTSLIQLIDRHSGQLEAILEAHWLGRLRTGAATAVAVKHLGKRNARVVGMFGSGRQAVSQLQALRAVMDVAVAKVFSRDREKLQQFCTTMSAELEMDVRPAGSPREVVEGADVIVTITRGGAPVFDGNWLESGQFISCAGVNTLAKHEIDLTTVRRAEVVVADSRDTARTESGDLFQAVEAGILSWENVIDFGDVAAGLRKGRTSETDIVLFESHGMALQDIYCAMHVVRAARERGVGSAHYPG
ncbi:ornithine cyclodeaminase family protein [Ferrovibrio sp.]|uniref:ornithine cyclodeaminase family protein n=1 Tax=Ferrovibrio sp. TaxID=1917215 RepID=UPI000CAA5ADA|nr:ornithine cyclodeaminase family protein [Ferrovibrio sp.]PJI42237.1 MAG: ornithine cyclodeaminase [Ferrovibrio sp.]